MVPPPQRHPLSSVASAIVAAADSLVLALGRGGEEFQPKVSPAQLRVLVAIEQNKSLNLSTLTVALNTIPSSASRLCDRLQAAGLIRREVCTADRREVTLMLSDRGRELLRNVHNARTRDVLRVLERMSQPQREALLEGLQAFGAAGGACARDDQGCDEMTR